MGGDYSGDGEGRSPPNILLGGRKRKRPPTIATFSKQKLDFFHFDYFSILFVRILYHKIFIPVHFHAESEEYAILA